MNSKKTNLPSRYYVDWRAPFDELMKPALVDGISILDVGSGRQPTIPPPQRPAKVSYTGFDLSKEELVQAPEGSFDETIEGDITVRAEELEGRFDLVISYGVLEHVKPLDESLRNLHSYLKPGGLMVVQMSGTFSVFGLINKALPQKLGVWAMKTFLKRNPITVFPAFYDRCYYSALGRLIEDWNEATVIPLYKGAGYFRFSHALQSLYVTYESWALKGNHHNLATHYIVTTRK